jgi:NAD(P)-dependent dehydrogenase (short-subunit alcohol dehydrogenase family)
MVRTVVEGRVAGQKAVVTGSGGAMGGAIARRLASEGADVVLNDRLADRAARWEGAISEIGRDVLSVHGNVTRRDEARRLIAAAEDRWGRVDILVNVVGGIKGPIANPVWEITEEEWEFAMGLNLRGTFHCTQAVLPGMMSRRQGKIVNIASVSWAGEALHAHYAAAKAAVVAFTRSAATQLGPYNINVNAVAPGATERDIDVDIPSALVDEIVMNPLGRNNVADDIANGVLFLVSEESRNISGQLLTIAGGANPHL